MRRTAVVFIHGLASGPKTWDTLTGLLSSDPDIGGEFECERFAYNSSLVGNRFLTKVPTYKTVAAMLRTRFERYSSVYDNIVFVTHSQGGLVLQTFLESVLAEGDGASLSRIRRIVLIACPNSGSAIFLLPRRLVGLVLTHTQERRLRPLNEEIADVHQRVGRQIANATEVSAASCPIPVMAFAAESDGIVTRASAHGSFPLRGVLPGTHKTVIRPGSHTDPGYIDLRGQLNLAFAEIEQHAAPGGDHRASPQIPVPTTVNGGHMPVHNLPQESYAHFVGRERETETLMAKLAPGDRTWLIMIDGIGGVGKTALAVEVARRLVRPAEDTSAAGDYFDAVVWSSAKRDILTADGIKPRRPEFTTLHEMYVAICSVLEEQDLLRLPEAEQHAEVQRILRGPRRVLLILDNLESVEDERIVSFLRELPQPAKSIVTSRHRIDVAYSIRLEGLRPEEAEDLIERESRRRGIVLTPGQVADLRRKTGGIPLALLWSLGLMNLGHSVDSVLRRLGSGHSDITRFCFTESVAAIRGTPAERLLCALVLLDQPATREILGDAAGLGDDEIGRDDAVQVLLGLSLVNVDGDRIGLLPLTSTFGLGHLGDDPELESSVTASWLDALRAHCKAFGRLNAEWRDASRLVRVGPHLRVAYERAASRGETDDALLFGWVRLMYLEVLGHWDESLTFAAELDALARTVSDTDSVLHLSWLRAYLHAQRGEFDAATAVLDDVESLATSPMHRVQYLLCRAQVSRRSGDRAGALGYLDQSQSLAEQVSGEEARMPLASVLFERGKIARDDRDWAAAKRWFGEASRYFDAEAAAEGLAAGRPPVYDIERALGILGNLGFLEYRLGHPQTARRLLTRAITITRAHGPAANLVTLLQQMAEVELDLGDLGSARSNLDEALALAKRLRIAQELEDCLRLDERLAEAESRRDDAERRR